MVASRQQTDSYAGMEWWWLSFVDPKKPAGARFAGVCIVRAANLAEAMREAWRQKCNPGGEVQGVPWAKEAPEPAAEWINRLLSKEDVARFEAAMRRSLN